jgi:hypothetical protein
MDMSIEEVIYNYLQATYLMYGETPFELNVKSLQKAFEDEGVKWSDEDILITLYKLSKVGVIYFSLLAGGRFIDSKINVIWVSHNTFETVIKLSEERKKCL